MIRRASGSLISRCRGTGWDTPVAGLQYQSCLPPCRTKMHPLASSRSDQIDSFHGITNSPTLRAPGIWPPERSR